MSQCCKEIVSFILGVFNIFYLVSDDKKNHIMQSTAESASSAQFGETGYLASEVA